MRPAIFTYRPGLALAAALLAFTTAGCGADKPDAAPPVRQASAVRVRQATRG